jgi:hypothetical protein
MNKNRKVQNGDVRYKNSGYNNEKPTPQNRTRSDFTPKRRISKPAKQSKKYADSQAHLHKPEKNKNNRKVKGFIHPKLDTAVKVRNFTHGIINGCNVIQENILVDFDRAKKQIALLKDEVEHLAKEIQIANSSEILNNLNINFTTLEELQDPSIDIKALTKNHIKNAQNIIKELYKEIQDTKYIKYNKPKIILLLRYLLECFKSLFISLSKATDNQMQDKDNLADKSQQNLHIEQDDKENDLFFDDLNESNKDTYNDLEATESTIDTDNLEEDGVYLDTIEHTDNGLSQTINISNSELINYGNTCWLNSAVKLLYVMYYDDIKRKAEEILKKPQVSKQEKQLYTSILQLFNKLKTQEDASTEISRFLAYMFLYGRDIEYTKKKNPAIENIYGLIKDIDFRATIDPNNKNNEIVDLDLNSVRQCSADEFIEHFIDLMELNNDSNSLGEIDLEERYLNKDVLNSIGLADTEKPKAIKRNKVDEYRSNLIAINTENLQETDTNKDDLIRMLSDDSNTSDFSKEEKQKIITFLSTNDIDSKKGLVNVAYTRKFTANIEQLNTVTVNLQAATAQNSFIKNKKVLNKLFNKNYPYIIFNVLNRSDNKMYQVTARAISCAAHVGSRMTSGHYIACSIDENNQVTIHNDSDNYKLPATKSLQRFVKQEGFTPIVIGYAVTDKRLIG